MHEMKGAGHEISYMYSYTSGRPFSSYDYFRGTSKLINNVIIMTLTGEGVDSQGLSGMIIA